MASSDDVVVVLGEHCTDSVHRAQRCSTHAGRACLIIPNVGSMLAKCGTCVWPRCLQAGASHALNPGLLLMRTTYLSPQK